MFDRLIRRFWPKRPAAKTQLFSRPRLEQLEDRCTPAVLTVNTVADNTVADNSLTLREAILKVDGTLGRTLTASEQAQISGTLGSNDTIQFVLPSGAQTITLSGGALPITRAVSIVGSAADLLTIDGNKLDRVFVVGTIYTRNVSLVVSISGVTIADGNAAYGGGLVNFGTLTISNCVLANNKAGSSGGGAIYNVGALTLNLSTLTGNSANPSGNGAPAGGAINNSSPGILSISNCSFSSNSATGTGSTAGSGGGVSNSGQATITNSTFTRNSAGSNGAAIHNSGSGNLTLDTCEFADNSAGSDGGGFDNDGVAKASNCTFSGNSANTEGGAIDNHGSIDQLINCTLVGNAAGSRGGAINSSGAMLLVNCTITANRVLATTSGGGLLCTYPAILRNTIVAGNFQGAAPSTTPNNIVGTVNSSSANNLIGLGGSGGLTNGVNGNQVGVSNAGLGPLADNGGPTQTVALLAGSPAIDRGNNAYVTAGETDQRGLTRVVNGTVDIGAFEVQPAPTGAITSTAPADQNVTAGTDTSFDLGSFADTHTAASPWSVDVDWGDGSSHTVFTVNATGSLPAQTHTYQTANNNTVTVKVTNANGDASQATFHALVSGAITSTAPADQNVTAVLATSFNLGSFSDTHTAAGPWSVDVDWGDGSSHTMFTVNVTGSLPAQTHTYQTANNYTVTVKVTNANGDASQATFHALVSAPTGAITSTPPTDQNVTAGTATSFNLGSFSDTHTAAGPWSVDVDWGDGSSHTMFTVNVTGSLPAQTHTYQTANDNTVTVKVTNVNGDASQATFHALVSAPTGAITSTPPTDQSVTAGAATSFNLGSFSDTHSAAGPWSVDVDWGDGSSHTTFTVNVTGSLPAQTHTYQTANNYTVTVKVTNVNGDASQATFHALVSAPTGAITSTPPTDQNVTAGAATSFNLGSFSDTHTAAGPWSVDVDWGDGSSHTTFTVNITGSLPAQTHTYQTANNYTVTVKVTNVNGDASQATFHALVSAPTSTATVLTVNSTADNTTADSVLTLREAILLVNGTLGRSLSSGEQAQITGTQGNNTTIQFSLASGPQTISLTGGALTITRAVSIVGPGADTLTISGSGLDRVFVIGQIFQRDVSLVVSFSGLTIADGKAVYGGGLVNFGTLTVLNCTFKNNHAGASGGGALYNVGVITVNNSTFTTNAVDPGTTSSGAGGAIYNNSAGVFTMANCTLSGNSANGNGSAASSGGAVANSGTLTADACTFATNSATSSGGGISNTGTLTVTASTFSDNTAGANGGGIRSAGTLSLTNCTFAGNYAESRGGALDSADVKITLTNCTLATNRAGSAGGGINVKGTTGTTPPKLFNTIVAGNFKGRGSNAKADDIAGSIDLTSAYNLIGAGGSGGLKNGVNNNQVGVTNLGLGPLADNGGPTKTMALLSGSPAINHGSNAYVAAGGTDQRGLTRIVNGTVDIGAFEVQS